MNSTSAHKYFQTFKEKLQAIFGPEEGLAITNYVCTEELLIKWNQLAYLDKTLSDEEVLRFDKMLFRLLQTEPLQQVLGYAWFCGLKFKVNRDVLIPRPETEELVELVLAHYTQHPHPATLVDLGTGTGCIPISLKKSFNHTSIFGVDLIGSALQVAAENAHLNKVDVTFAQANMLDFDFMKKLFSDLAHPICLISNPPYIAQSEEAQMHSNVLKYEPHTALFVPDDNPLLFYEAIAQLASNELKSGDTIWLEVNPLLANQTLSLFATSGYTEVLLINDMQGKQRFINVII
jgi:release factor glutamine methyltransferase